MAVLTASIVADATGYAVKADAGQADGICEKALVLEPEALAEVAGVLGATVYAEVTGTDYSTAEATSTEGLVYARLLRSTARLAVAEILPTVGAGRPSSRGGIQAASGPESERVQFVHPAEVRRMAADLRERALADLRRIAEAVGGASDTDALYTPDPIYTL